MIKLSQLKSSKQETAVCWKNKKSLNFSWNRDVTFKNLSHNKMDRLLSYLKVYSEEY